MGRRTGRKSLPREASCAAASRPEPTGASRRSSTGASTSSRDRGRWSPPRRPTTGTQPGSTASRAQRELREHVWVRDAALRRVRLLCLLARGLRLGRLCSYCGAGPDAEHLVSVALADARALEPLERTVDVARPGRAGRSRESAPSTKQAAEPARPASTAALGVTDLLRVNRWSGRETLARYQAATPR